jgi:uncharacterized protein with GYD domain
MKWIVFIPLALMLSGCGLLGISPDEAREETAKIRRDMESVKTAIDNAARINDVRAEIAATNAKIESALMETTAAFDLIAEFMSNPNATKEDAEAVLEVIQRGLTKSKEAVELVGSIDAKFGETELTPEIAARIKQLAERADKTIRTMTETAARVEKVANAVKAGLGIVGQLAGGASGTGGIIGTLLGVATLAGAAASGMKKGGTS